MARSGGSAQKGVKPAKLTRAEKKEARATKRRSRRESFRNLKQAFVLTKQNDPRFVPYLVMVFVVGAALAYLVVFLITGSPLIPIAFAVIVGLFAALFMFSRRAQHTMFRQAEGQPGAAGWMLQQQLRGDWRLTQAVAGTTQLDAVHRLVGRPGVVLVGEGAPHRVKGLIAQEKKRTARVVGETPIYDVIVGTGEGDLRLSKLNRYLLKLPANLSKEQVGTLEKRLAALGGGRAALPQGPMPQGAKMRNVQRTVRRRT
jgi:F0F1-type ATP synthase assembly protein I